MTESFLILHKVRGAPAFDIAEQHTCPECSEHDPMTNSWVSPKGCDECDHQGFWWVIPTSGHRAYPYEKWEISIKGIPEFVDAYLIPDIIPDGWPDHYPSRHPPPAPALDLISALGIKPSVPTDFKRRV